MNISELSLRRPVLALVLNILIVLFGVIGFKALGVRDYPAIDPPNITVRTSYPGANAEIIESQITEPLEKSINGIAGIKNVDIVIPGHSPVTTPKDLQEFQRFMTDWVAAVQAAATAGKSIDEATASIDLSAKYPSYKKERYTASITSVYAEKGRLRDGIGIEDLGLVSMALSNGVVATLDASWSRPAPRASGWG